jgi:hypothetical protein
LSSSPKIEVQVSPLPGTSWQELGEAGRTVTPVILQGLTCRGLRLPSLNASVCLFLQSTVFILLKAEISFDHCSLQKSLIQKANYCHLDLNMSTAPVTEQAKVKLYWYEPAVFTCTMLIEIPGLNNPVLNVFYGSWKN